jgi:murein DD-endopeptidase MepM/ murein hydrolase activator NlpD
VTPIVLTIIKPGTGATVNGRPVLFDAPPEARGGHVWGEFAPILRALGLAVSWSELSGRMIAVPCRVVPPLDGELVVTSAYGPRARGSKTFHSGVDLKAAMETPVYAIADGKVVWVGYDAGGFGRYVLLDHGEFRSIYAHLSSPTAAINLLAGERVGFSGGLGPGAGDSSGPHLHFGVYVPDPGTPLLVDRGGQQVFNPASSVDPMQFLKGV